MKALIVGASIDLDQIDAADIYIGADRGALTLIEQKIRPDVAIGDFDSVTENELLLIQNKSKAFYLHPAEKDQTDLELALLKAISFKPKKITIIHATGKRLDHYLSALHVIYYYQIKYPQIDFYLKNAENLHLFLTKGRHSLKKRPYKYLSLFAFDKGLVIKEMKGVKYGVKDAELLVGSSLFTSNEIISESAELKIESGVALVIYSN